jgi:hypothetical protein
MVQPPNYVSDRGQSSLKAHLGLDMSLKAFASSSQFSTSWIHGRTQVQVLYFLYHSGVIRLDNYRSRRFEQHSSGSGRLLHSD